MKLLAKYNRVNLIATIIILLLSSVCYYFIVRYILIYQLDQDLKVEEQEVRDFIRINHKLPHSTSYKDQQVKFDLAKAPLQRSLHSRNIFNKEENEYNSIRELIFPVTIENTVYKVSISKSMAESEDLLKLIVLITLGITIVLLVTLFIINRLLLNKLWLPFNKTLHELKQFNLSGKKNVQLESSSITEFKELNEAVLIMTNQVRQDYDSLKSFTENASHEMQTPLAIIKSKLEILVQSEHLNGEQVQTIHTIGEAVNRLSKLHKSLILLAKIENQQFHEKQDVDLVKILNRHLSNYEELIGVKQIKVSRKIENDLCVVMNDALAEILISNLITNAIKHNIENGLIEISVRTRKLIISNTGQPLKSDPEKLFERFQKDRIGSESLGLGLSIVKKITEQYGFKIKYSCDETMHRIELSV